MLSSLIPMLAITGRPNHEQIDSILARYNSVDINQIMLYPRSGCELEYLSEEWFSVLEYFICQGRKYGMRFWLYDEMNWPSGSCNGMITSVPEYRLKALSKKNGTIEIVCGSGDWENRACPDVLCPEAVELFINNTHERYKTALGQYFGKEVIGIFTDEPGYIYESWMVSRNFSESIPYYNGMKEDFSRATNGKDLFEEYLRADAKSCWFFRTVTELLKKRFQCVYLLKIRDWCEQNGLLLTGHLFNESPLVSSVQCNGNVIEQMQSVSLPGMDDIRTHLFADGIEWDTLASVACAAEHNRRGAMAELFALGPCDMRFITHEKMIALCAAHKIDHYFLAVAPVDLRGNAIKNQYFNPFSSVQPWFAGLRELNRFAARAAKFATLEHTAEIEILYPSREISEQLGDVGKSEQMSAEFTAFLKGLIAAQIPWKFVLEKSGGSRFLFGFENGLLRELNGGNTFDSADRALDWLEQTARREIEVLDEQGNRRTDVFVRMGKDGAFVLVDLVQEREKLPIVVRYGQQTRETVLYGCMISDVQTIMSAPLLKQQSVCAEFEYTSCNLTPYRPFFKDTDSIRIQAEEEFSVVAAIRRYPTAADITINGERCIGTENCTVLPDGAAELYTQTKSVLKKGINTICCDRKDEINYLPSVILFGQFETESKAVLKSRTREMDCAKVFGGVSEIAFEAQVPSGEAVWLQAENNSYFCELFADGEELGKTVGLNQKFFIPQNVCGRRIRFVLRYYSSVSAYMGEIQDVLPGYESKPDQLQKPLLKWLIQN